MATRNLSPAQRSVLAQSLAALPPIVGALYAALTRPPPALLPAGPFPETLAAALKCDVAIALTLALHVLIVAQARTSCTSACFCSRRGGESHTA